MNVRPLILSVSIRTDTKVLVALFRWCGHLHLDSPILRG